VLHPRSRLRSSTGGACELALEAVINRPDRFDLIVLDDLAYVSKIRLWKFPKDDRRGPWRDAERDALTS
jgi:hypothetical protein